MEKMNLYKIDNTIRQILEQGMIFDEETGEVFFTADDLETLEMARDEKINNIIGYIKDLEINASNMKTIKDDYAKRQKSSESKAESLKRYLDGYLKTNGLDKGIETENGIVSYRKSKSVDIYDELALQTFIEEFQEFAKIKIEPSKTDIKKAIEDGKVIPGANIKENINMSIK